MGQAIARRLGGGRLLVLADYSAQILESAAKNLRQEGHIVQTYTVDVSDLASVASLAKAAGEAGHIDAIIHTAGVSPIMSTPRRIHEVDLLGTALVIDEFLPVASIGTSLICISSLAGHMANLSPELETHLATAPVDQLIYHKEIDLDKDKTSAAHAYVLAKRGNQLRVQAMARAWGQRGARINTISPGVIGTAMGNEELDGENGVKVKGLIAISPLGRIGTPDDIANVVAFLASPESSFVTGTDIRVDGGAFVATRW